MKDDSKMTILVTQQQRNNALEALHIMMPSVLEEDVVKNLNDWIEYRIDSKGPRSIGCGTLACFGGLCAAYAPFVEQGVYANVVGSPTMSGIVDTGQVSYFLFGDYNLFLSRNYGNNEAHFRGTDHALIRYRLRKLIRNSEVLLKVKTFRSVTY